MNLLSCLINNLMNTYIYEKKLNNYNYEIIENLKLIEKIKFPIIDFGNCKNIYEKSEKFISFYNKENQKINDNNKIKENIKKFNILNNKISNTLNYHTNWVNQIILLKDGRIASSSDDKSIIIYNKEDYSIQLKIKNLDDSVFNIIQGSNDYICINWKWNNFNF